MPELTGDTNDIDYSSFEYQHVEYQHEENGGDSARSTFAIGIDPLDQQGGLDINEVAELVGMYVTHNVAADDFTQTSQTQNGNVEYRGVLGSNLDSLGDLVSSSATAKDREETPIESNDNPDGQARTFGHSKAEVFHHFSTYLSTPFDDTTNGSGGGGAYMARERFVNFRDITGRGPVLDGNDEMSVVSRIIKNNVEYDTEAITRATYIWDVAEVDDAGRRFAIPRM